MMEKNDALKKEKRERVIKEGIPNLARVMDKELKSSGNGWLVGDSATYADFHLASILKRVSAQLGDSSWKAEFPDVSKFVDRVYSLPNIKAWCEKRAAGK